MLVILPMHCRLAAPLETSWIASEKSSKMLSSVGCGGTYLSSLPWRGQCGLYGETLSHKKKRDVISVIGVHYEKKIEHVCLTGMLAVPKSGHADKIFSKKKKKSPVQPLQSDTGQLIHLLVSAALPHSSMKHEIPFFSSSSSPSPSPSYSSLFFSIIIILANQVPQA